MKKRAVLLSALFSVSCLGLGLFALNQGSLPVNETTIVANAETRNGQCGQNLTWTLNDEGTLTISGTGAMEYDLYAPWKLAYHSDIRNVVLESGVTNIGDNAFDECENLVSVTIPSTVTSIGGGAFYSCSSLESITIPVGVTSIGDYAFNGCGNLTSVTLPTGLASIGEKAFEGCTKLENPVIPNSVTSIDYGAFWDCKAITSITIPAGVTRIEGSAFRECTNLVSVSMPNSVTSIGSYAFRGCSSLSDIKLSNSLTEIEDSAFDCCFGLTSLTIPTGVTSIGEYAFYYCDGVTSIIMPTTVTSIGYGAFNLCRGLTDVYYMGTEQQWNAIAIEESNDPLRNATKHFNYVPVQEEAAFNCASLILDGTLTVNFKMVANDLLVTNGGYAKVETTYYDGTFRDIERDYPLSALEVDGEGRYLLKVGMNPAQMNDNIRVTLYTGEDTSLSTVNYSVRQYCESKIQNSTNPEMVALAKAILNYGAATQEYVNYKTGTLANASLTSDEKAVVENHTIYTDNEYSASATERIEGVANVSATLLLDSTTSIRFKVTLGSGANISDYVIKVNGVVCEAERNGDVYSIYVRNIAAHQLRNMYTLTIEKDEATTTVRYGVWSYAQRVSSPAGQKLMKAMQLYSEATLEYMN